ncbi:MAG: class I SAM-dependent RNA methyltransferase [Verrucomicrobia bacterium]|nr:class I SAM-dependent RNA methyltransferase [Verrucomicrobiota bacterium]MDE3099513.1 class I SAM-dependent RNA methyltransferase [Verrucomicrobiota bacterium]
MGIRCRKTEKSFGAVPGILLFGMLKIGDRVSLTVDDVAFGGDGVGHVDQFVVFVPYVLTGETVEAEVTEVKSNFARAKLLKIIHPSPDRVEPHCIYFGKCGGCQYQHADYAAQLKMKGKQVADLFERIGKIRSDRIAPVVPCPQPYAYRNRILIRSQWNKPERKLNIGFVRWDCGLVEDIEECKISEPAINEQIKRLRAEPPPKGGLKVVLRVQPEEWETPPDSFFQNNFFMLPRLIETVRQCLENGQARNLIDLYCGVGFFGIELAHAVDRFAGVEYDRRAIQAARNNAARRAVANGEFIAGKVEEVLPGLIKRFSPETTAVVLDPPRKGCEPGPLQLLRETRPAQVVYVSCHPATMARDLNVLCRDNVFELRRVQPLDMFPQTQHVECVADLRRGN